MTNRDNRPDHAGNDHDAGRDLDANSNRPATGQQAGPGRREREAEASDATLEIRPVADDELEAAFALLRVLRPHLDGELFRARLHRQRGAYGYELIGAWLRPTPTIPSPSTARGEPRSAPRLVGLIGLRPNESMAWGSHLHVDDLVTDELERGRGIGRALMRWCEREAVRRGTPAVYLEARVTAIGFYEREGYERHPSPVMKRLLDGE